MPDKQQKKGYIEDDFELENFKKKASILKKYESFKKKNKKLAQFLFIITIILAFAIAYFAYQILDYYIGLRRNEYIRDKTKEIAQVQTAAPSATPAPLPATPTPLPTATPATAVPTVRPLLPQISELRQAFSNEDIVGYLQIEGTNIDYAVAQSTDNEFYLHRDLYANNNVAGSIFMDYENTLEELDDNTIIYGHNMGNGSMFHNLRYYADKQYFEAHPYISLVTPYEETRWEIFSFYRTDTNFYYLQTNFADRVSFFSLLYQMKEKSMYETGVSVDATDKILTLSTCTNASDDSRYVLNAKLIPD